MQARSWLGLCCAVLGTLAAGDARAAEAGFRTLDLKPIVNMDWRDEIWGDGKGGWTDQGDNDLRQIDVGRRELLGIPFQLIDPASNGGKAVLTLGSKKFPAGPLTATVAFGGTARSLYFLHAAAWSGGHMANYVIHYADGSSAEIPIRDKEAVMNWWYPTHGDKYRAAIHVPNAQTDDVGLVAFAWDNPQPQKVIGSIEFQSLNADGIVVVAAVTASDQPAHLPDPQDIPTPDYLRSDLDTLDNSQWFPVEAVEDRFEPTPIDQSAALDAPAGKHGFMKTVEGRWAFEDGAPVRLVATMQGTPRDKKQSEYMARWLAKYGFNLVRIGHLVTGPEKGSAVDWSRPDSGHLNPEVMDQLDYFMAELAKRGIYSRPSLLWYRKLKKGDGVEAFDESVAFADQKANRKRPPGEEPVLDSVGITFFDPKVMQANIALEQAILTHRNPYRGNQAYGEDPAIAQIEVTNEDGVFFYTIDGIAPPYAKQLDRLWAEWLLKRYGTQEQLAAAWGEGLKADERLADGTVKRLGIWELNKVKPEKTARAQDQLKFYFELNNAYFQKTKTALRAAGVRQPICGTGWFGVGTGFYAELYSNVPGMDYIDRHHYYGGGPGGWQILPGQPFNHEAALTEPKQLLKLGMERVLGLPYGISEWANVLPNQWRLEAPPLMTFYGQCLNGWDAPIHFALEGTEGGFTRFAQMDVAHRRTLDAVPIPSARAGHPPRRRAPGRPGLRPQSVRGQGVRRPALEGRGHQSRHLRPLRDVVGARRQCTQPGQLLRRGRRQDGGAFHTCGRAGFLDRPDQVPRPAEERDPLDDGRIVLELRPRLRHRQYAADAGRDRLPDRGADPTGGLRDPHDQPLRLDPGHVVGRKASATESAHPDHGGGPVAQHRHGLQSRRAAVAGDWEVARAAGGCARLGGAPPRRHLRGHRTLALRLQDRRRGSQRCQRPDRHPARRPEPSGVLRRAISLGPANQ